jgi:lipopolysaccharide transport system ATP-binding protein
MSNIAIKVENLSKIYRLGEIGTGSIGQDVDRWFKTKILGKDDPFLKIGETNDRANKGASDIVYSLQDINFEINQGDAVGIIGRNGAGKSTLLKILSRVTTPTTGKINIKGRVASLLEVGTGFHPELTGRENIYLNGAILGMRKREIDRKLDEIIDFSGVERYIDTPVKRYSSGMYVRLAFAVAAHLESEILIVDEVLAVGDAEFQKKCLGKMGEVSKGEGRTVLFVSHNMAAVKNLCGTGLLMNNGFIESSGQINEVLEDYYKTSQKLISKGATFSKDVNENSSVMLTTAKLIDMKNEITDSFEINETITIQLEIQCNDKIPGLYGYININDSQDNLLIECDTKEYSDNALDSLELGLNKFRVVIPGNILPHGKKHMYLSFGGNNLDMYTIESPGNILSFEIRDNITTRNLNRKSFTSHLLQWDKI